MSKQYIIGIDIGGTNVRIGAVSPELELAALDKVKKNRVFSGDRDKTISELILFIEEFIVRYDLNGQIVGISIGFPATINRKRTGVIQAPNVQGMNDMEVVEPLNEHFGLPIYVNRDVCMALYYDAKKYQIPDEGITIACYIGTGIGNVISIDGRHIAGKDGTSGELGHIPVVGNDSDCGCGIQGCIDNVAAGVYLTKLCDTVYFNTPIEELFTRHGQDHLLLEAVDNMAIAVATEINILNPDRIVLGGGVLAMADFPLEFLAERIKAHTRHPYPAESLELIFAEDVREKGAVGAAIYAMECQKGQPMFIY